MNNQPKISKRPVTQKAYKENKNLPTGFVHHLRLCVHQPYTRVIPELIATKKHPIIFSTSFGEVIFKVGYLDQTHLDILQVLTAYPHRFGVCSEADENGLERRTYSFSAYEMLKALNLKTKNQAWLIEKLEEMAAALFTLIPSKNEELKRYFKGGKVTTSIFHYVWSNKEFSDKIDVELSPFFLGCFLYDTAIHLEHLTEEILSVRQGYLKALVRHCLSHQIVNRKLEDILMDIGLPSKEENAKIYSDYKVKITSPESIKTLFDKFKITVKQNTDQEWVVNYKQSGLDGKVWSDNEKTQYSRVCEHNQLLEDVIVADQTNITEKHNKFVELQKARKARKLSMKEDEELFELNQLYQAGKFNM